MDETALLDSSTALLRQHDARYCVIGGQGVNTYVEPLVSLDLDLAVAAEDLAPLEHLLAERFRVEQLARLREWS